MLPLLFLLLATLPGQSECSAVCVSGTMPGCVAVEAEARPSLMQRRYAVNKELSPGVPRHVYIDLGANWANTLRLYRDLYAPTKGPWEVYAFEASPLIQPYLDEFVRWLNGAGPKPDISVPPSGSSAHLRAYAPRYGCPRSSPNGSNDTSMRECMFQVFKGPLGKLHADPHLADPQLIKTRLAMASTPLDGESHDRFVVIPAAGGAENGSLTLHSMTAEQMIRGGALTTPNGTDTLQAKVAMVDVAAWMGAHFRPEDHVVVKMDIEGAEFSIIDKMERNGWMDVIDVLAMECHPWAGNCDALLRKLRAQKDLDLLTEGEGYVGWDSLSTPDLYYPKDPRPAALTLKT